VRNKCIDYLRHQQRHLQYIDFCLNITKDYAEDKDIVEMEQRQKQIDATINQLQPPTRDIFLACYVEQKKYKEVAAERGISVATVRKHIVKALRIIREYNKLKK
jgi:RNA polymerase sigma-70 factor (ECF subfamily)